ncbi:MAG: hypothetical protein ACREC5_05375, partial [Thermoplasmata archaeon]
REATAGTALAVDRLGGRAPVGPESIEAAVEERLARFTESLVARAEAAFRDAFATAGRLEDLKGSARVRLFGWCGAEACGHEIEQAIDGSLLGTLLGAPPGVAASPPGCLVCGASSGAVWAAAGRPV